MDNVANYYPPIEASGTELGSRWVESFMRGDFKDCKECEKLFKRNIEMSNVTSDEVRKTGSTAPVKLNKDYPTIKNVQQREELSLTVDYIKSIRGKIQLILSQYMSDGNYVIIPWWNIKRKLERSIRESILKKFGSEVIDMLTNIVDILEEKINKSIPDYDQLSDKEKLASLGLVPVVIENKTSDPETHKKVDHLVGLS
jgi:hypothetical protein